MIRNPSRTVTSAASGCCAHSTVTSWPRAASPDASRSTYTSEPPPSGCVVSRQDRKRIRTSAARGVVEVAGQLLADGLREAPLLLEAEAQPRQRVAVGSRREERRQRVPGL